MSKDQADKVAELKARGWVALPEPPAPPGPPRARTGGDVVMLEPPNDRLWLVKSDGSVVPGQKD